MKLLSIICILIITALNMVPCTDVHNENAVSSSISAADADNQPCSSPDDHCTPFCHCGCCGSHLVAVPCSSFSAFEALHQNEQLFHIAGHFFNIGEAVWQPPKLTA